MVYLAGVCQLHIRRGDRMPTSEDMLRLNQVLRYANQNPATLTGKERNLTKNKNGLGTHGTRQGQGDALDGIYDLLLWVPTFRRNIPRNE